jgi:hypothetical protein
MIGTKLYHYLTLRGIGTYEIIGIDGDFILVKSLACNNKNHPCIVKLNRVDGYKTRWKYVSMMQNCGDDTYENSKGEEVHNEYMWHCDSHYFERKADLKKWKGDKIVSDNKDEIEKMKDEIKKLQERIKKREENIKEITLWMDNTEV